MRLSVAILLVARQIVSMETSKRMPERITSRLIGIYGKEFACTVLTKQTGHTVQSPFMPI